MSMRVCAMVLLACLAMLARATPLDPSQGVIREMNMREGCHFTIKDPYLKQENQYREPVYKNGSIFISFMYEGNATDYYDSSGSYTAHINPQARHPFGTRIQFSCDPATSKIYLDSASIKLTDKGWALDLSKEDPRPPSPHTTLYLLRGRNWEGAGTTQDDTDGDEDRRVRTFGFCIPHHQLALCGMTRHVGYLEHLNESVLPHVIQLLESIEFIDMLPAKPTDISNPLPPDQ